jgi:general secretion pathway protein G
MFKIHKQKGFTLVELLIVITIIGVLAVALVPRLTGGTSKARDAKRKADLQQIATALEFSADDNAGAYPAAGCVDGTAVGAPNTDLINYLTTIPTDPLAGNTADGAQCGSGGYNYYEMIGGYLIVAAVESDLTTGEGLYTAPTVAALTLDGTSDFSTEIATATDCPGDGTVACVYVLGR